MQTLKADIKNKTFRHVYLLCGEERFLRRHYGEMLWKALGGSDDDMNSHVYDGKDITVGAMIDLAETLPFLAERRVIYVKNSGLFKSGSDPLADYLAAPCDTAYFIFSEDEVDKRTKLYKTVQKSGYAAEFPIQDEASLKRWIAGFLGKNGKRITESTANLILAKSGTDMDNLEMELEKLLCYCMDRDTVTDQDVETICTTRVTNHIFEMIDAVSEGKTRRALDLYYDLLALKEPPMRILALIGRQCNLLLQAKKLRFDGYDSKDIAAKIGVPPFAVKKYLSQASRFKSAALRQALADCVRADESVKMRGMDERLSVELLLLSLAGGEESA